MTTYGSLFSGVGGFDLGCDAAGWDCVWQVEYDARCRQVLARHWPELDRYDDVRTVNGRELAPVDVITYGFPCQDLSVAGKRAGLDGHRSGLFFEAIRIIREMREATDGTYPRVAVAENVVGLLSADGGAAMGRCLDALAEVGALAVEWRVLDAQWFGVPQRRRRVFLVAVFDPRAASAGQVFPEPESVRRDLAAQREAQETVAGTLGGGSGERGWSCDTDRMTFLPAITGTVTTTWAKGPGNTRVEEGHIQPTPQGVRRLTPASANGCRVGLTITRATRQKARKSLTVPVTAWPGTVSQHPSPSMWPNALKRSSETRMEDDLYNVRFIATVDQLAAIIRDSLDRLDAPITDRRVQMAVGFTARLLLEMDPNPNTGTLATHAAIQSALEAVR